MSLVDELIAATVDAREAVREAHETIKDLRTQLREAKAYVGNDEIKQQIDRAVASEMERLAKEVNQVVKSSESSMMKHFTVLASDMEDTEEKFVERIINKIIEGLLDRIRSDQIPPALRKKE
jgi:hypothetical protein